MPKVSPEHKSGRRDEIINACDELYKTMGFREITLKEIGQITSFSRPSIYNYFKTKEEIFLALLTREYETWTEDINSISADNEMLSAEELSDAIAKTLEKRETMLKIAAMNLYEIEDNSSLERLQDFKVAFGAALDAVLSCVDKFMPERAEEKKNLIHFGFFPFMNGIYPYTSPTEKQLEAMKNVGFEYKSISIYNMVYKFLCQLFK